MARKPKPTKGADLTDWSVLLINPIKLARPITADDLFYCGMYVATEAYEADRTSQSKLAQLGKALIEADKADEDIDVPLANAVRAAGVEAIGAKIDERAQEYEEKCTAMQAGLKVALSVVHFMLKAHQLPPDISGTYGRVLGSMLQRIATPRPTAPEEHYALMRAISEAEGFSLWSEACAKRAAEVAGKKVSTMESARKHGSPLWHDRIKERRCWQQERRARRKRDENQG